MIRLRTLRLLPVVLLVGLAACSDDSATGPELGFDPVPLIDLMWAHEATFQVAEEGNDFLARTLPELESMGVEFDPAGTGSTLPRLRADGPAGPLVQPRVTFPPEVQGRTFVYDDGTASWVIDDAATGAPAEGIRITWYEVDGSGFPISTQVLGYIDLTDEDAGGLSILGVTIVSTSASGVGVEGTIAEYTVGYATVDGTETSEEFQAQGWVDDGARRLDFTVDGEGTANETTGESSSRFDMTVSGPDGSYDLHLTQDVAGTTTTQDWRITLGMDGQTTVLDMDLTEEGSTASLSGTVTHQGRVEAMFSGDSENAVVFTNAAGERFEGAEQIKLQQLFGTALEMAFYYLLYALPVLVVM